MRELDANELKQVAGGSGTNTGVSGIVGRRSSGTNTGVSG
tara:strand:+ start:1173 stop:1292 length:120 start_codon:yes stop_codon:yes gene_type:complete